MCEIYDKNISNVKYKKLNYLFKMKELNQIVPSKGSLLQ